MSTLLSFHWILDLVILGHVVYDAYRLLDRHLGDRVRAYYRRWRPLDVEHLRTVLRQRELETMEKELQSWL